MPPVIPILFGAAFTVASATAAGTLLLRRLRVTLARGEATLLAFVCGSACISMAVFLLCLVHAARPAVLLGGGAAAICWALRGKTRRKPLPAIPRMWFALFLLIFIPFFVMYFFNALAPEISPDGSGYHLGNVLRMWHRGGFDWGNRTLYAELSQGMEMLFLVAFTFGRHSAAALVHFAFLTALPLLILCYGRRFGYPQAGVFAAVLTFASPVAGIDGISAYNDVAVATVIFAAFYLLQVWDEKRDSNLLILIGLLVGFGYGLKYTAIVFLAALPLCGLRKPIQLKLAIPLAVMILPWMARNWIWIGNPVAPFFNRWFPNPYFDAAMEHEYISGLAHFPGFAQLTIYGRAAPGILGPVFLLAPFALLALRSRQGRRLLAAAAVMALPTVVNCEPRFWIASVPFLALAMGIAMENSPGVLPALAVFHAVVSWPAVLGFYCDPAAWRLARMPVRAALRITPEAEFLTRRLPGYALKPAIEREVPPGQKIFSIAGRPEAYIDRDIVVGYESKLGNAAWDALAAHDAAKLKALGIRYLWIDDADPCADSLKNNMKITEIAHGHGNNLYRLE